MLVSSNVMAASLPPTPYGNGEFEGFPEGIQIDPLLGVVDPTAPPMNLGDPCPCTTVYDDPLDDPDPTTGTCAFFGGTLIIDPYDGDGLTCNNPNCPCDYYVTNSWLEGMFLGFPFPLNNEILVLFMLSLLYAVWLIIKKHILRAEKA